MNEILELAAKMPTGLIDPKSLEKAHHEMEEMRDALAGGDILGALMEAADVMYYAHKAYCNGLIAVDGRDGLIGDACREVGFDSHAVECALLAKYKLRALNQATPRTTLPRGRRSSRRLTLTRQ